MAKPPSNDERRYQGRVRANMAMMSEAITRLKALSTSYLAGPPDSYPNQLAPAADIVQLNNSGALVDGWLAAQGPIPNRPGSP